jgi:hypothetical protein
MTPSILSEFLFPIRGGPNKLCDDLNQGKAFGAAYARIFSAYNRCSHLAMPALLIWHPILAVSQLS